MNILATTLGILTLTVSGMASSSIIDNGLYTTDTQSGLDWLDLSETVGLSQYEVSHQLGSGGDFDGWHYASGNIFNALWSSITSTILDGTYGQQSVNDSTALSTYQSLFGITRTFSIATGQTPIVTSRESLGLTSDIGLVVGFNQAASVIDDIYNNNNDYFEAHSSTFAVITKRDYLGSWLVRNSSTTVAVPEPSIIALFSFGLLGMTLVQRRNKRNKLLAA